MLMKVSDLPERRSTVDRVDVVLAIVIVSLVGMFCLSMSFVQPPATEDYAYAIEAGL